MQRITRQTIENIIKRNDLENVNILEEAKKIEKKESYLSLKKRHLVLELKTYFEIEKDSVNIWIDETCEFKSEIWESINKIVKG